MNVTIARMQKASRQLVGLFIVVMNWLALAVSACTIAIGAAIFGYQQMNSSSVGKYGGTIVFLIIGAAIGVIIEGLTASNCAALRKRIIAYTAMKQAHAKVVDKTDVIREIKEEQKSTHQWNIAILVFSIALSSSLSIAGGTLFWHYVLQSMNDVVMSWIVSTGFSSAVSIALIISELRKATNDELVQEALSTISMIKAAYQADMEEMMLDRLFKTAKSELTKESKDGELFLDSARHNAHVILDSAIGSGNGSLIQLLKEKQEEREAYTVDAMQQLETPLPSTEKLPVIDLGEAPKYRRDKQAKIDKLQKEVARHGWSKVYNNAKEVCTRLDIGESTFYRYMADLKEEVTQN